MSLQVRLYLRPHLINGSRPYLNPVYQKNGKPQPLYALLDGEPRKFENGVYYLRYTADGVPTWEAVGTNLKVVATKKLQREQILAGKANGLVILGPSSPGRRKTAGKEQPAEKGRETGLATYTTIETYLQDTSKYKRARTYTTYKNALEPFREACVKPFLHQIERRDILAFIDALKKGGNGRRTVSNKVKNVLIFLRKQGFKEVLPTSDVPTYTEKIVKAYQPEPLATLFAAADWEDLMLLQFFLGSGGRDNEVVHAGMHDIDFKLKTYDVREQPDFPKFEVKDFEERVVPLPDELIEMLLEHRQRHPNRRLLFPRADGNPDNHLLKRLKALAFKAGLNCGRCVKKNKKTGAIKTCDQFPVCKDWTLHRFRKTFATMHSDNGVKLETISAWLGHSDIETTKAYLEVGLASSDQTRQQVNSSFPVLKRRSC